MKGLMIVCNILLLLVGVVTIILGFITKNASVHETRAALAFGGGAVLFAAGNLAALSED